jgi:hypothetical protein
VGRDGNNSQHRDLSENTNGDRRSKITHQRSQIKHHFRPLRIWVISMTNAGSIASLMLTTEALIADLPEEKQAAAASSGQGGMGGTY